jgi:hypothetical protein
MPPQFMNDETCKDENGGCSRGARGARIAAIVDVHQEHGALRELLLGLLASCLTLLDGLFLWLDCYEVS